jgi:hypothetical protein
VTSSSNAAFYCAKKEDNMQINIVEEIYKIRASLLEAVNNNPLPTTVKLLVVNELANALEKSEVNEIRSINAKAQEDKKKEVEKTDG